MIFIEVIYLCKKFGNKKLGFGLMRLPQNKVDKKDLSEDKVNFEELSKMVDYFLENGFNYFDTAHGYHGGLSEVAVKKCLSSRHKREEYILTNKLTAPYFNSQEEIYKFFNEQLHICGVDYFDNYLIHAVSKNNYQKFLDCKAFESLIDLKNKGLIKHIGMSFHDSPELLDEILKSHPELEMIQLQINYIDFEDKKIKGKENYEIARKYNKDIIVMEPVKGGKLANLPKEAENIFSQISNFSPASYAIRYVASFDGVEMVLSGMSSLEQMKDNMDFMTNFEKLNEKDYVAIEKVVKILKDIDQVPCTFCEYCIEGCPKNIFIPKLIELYNAHVIYPKADYSHDYELATRNSEKAGSCISCKKCEKICPQHIAVTPVLKKISFEFES